MKYKYHLYLDSVFVTEKHGPKPPALFLPQENDTHTFYVAVLDRTDNADE